MQRALLDAIAPLLVENVSILDVGAGRGPTLALASRPRGAYYVGLDISADELGAAEPTAYDATVVQDVASPIQVDRAFDLVISWQVLEHVDRVDLALDNLREVLKPGGTLVAQLSGSRSVFALLARAMPHPLRVSAMTHLLGDAVEDKFPTRFDRCTARWLRQFLATWTSVEVLAHYRGATYFNFFSPLQRAYLAYENRIEKAAMSELATHYLVIARR